MPSPVAQYRAYVGYKVLSDELFQPLKPPDWSAVSTWTAERRKEEFSRLRTLYFRNKMCLERRLRYKFDYVLPTQWDDGHEKAILEAKAKTHDYLNLLEKFTLTVEDLLTKQSQNAKVDQAETASSPVANVHRKYHQRKSKRKQEQTRAKCILNKSPCLLDEHFAHFTKEAKREGDVIYEGLYAKIHNLIEQHSRKVLTFVELDALTSTAISMISWETKNRHSWKDRAIEAQRALATMSSSALDNIVLNAIRLYGPLIAELSKAPDPPANMKVACDDPGCPPALKPLMRRASIVSMEMLAVTHIQSAASFKRVQRMLVINTVLNGCGTILGDYQLVDRSTTWATILNLRTVLAATSFKDLIGETIVFKPSLLWGPEAEAIEILVLGVPNFSEHVAKVVKHDSDALSELLDLTGEGLIFTPPCNNSNEVLRQFRICLGKQLNHPAAHYKIIYLLFAGILQISDVVLQPRKFIRTLLVSQCRWNDDSFNHLRLNIGVVTFCLFYSYGATLLDIAVYFLQMEGWPLSIRDQLDKVVRTRHISPAWRLDELQPADCALLADDYDEFCERFSTCTFGPSPKLTL